MSVLLRRENLTYRDQIIQTAGHAFVNCTFDGCTMLVREATAVLDNCTFVGCVWQFDLFVADREKWTQLLNTIGPLLMASLPSAATAPAARVDPGNARASTGANAGTPITTTTAAAAAQPGQRERGAGGRKGSAAGAASTTAGRRGAAVR